MALTRAGLGVAALAVLIAIWMLPPRACSEAEESLTMFAVCGGTVSASRPNHTGVLRMSQRRLRERIKDLVLADSIRRALSGPRVIASADRSIVVLYDGHVDPDTARFLLQMAVAELERIPGTGTLGRAVLVVGGRTYQQLSELPEEQREFGMRHVVSATAAGPECYTTVNYRVQMRASVFSADERGRFGATLSTCALVVRFGMPSPAMLRLTEWAFDRHRQSWRSSNLAAAMSEARSSARTESWSIQEDACGKGIEESCAAMLGFGNQYTFQWDYRPALLYRALIGSLLVRQDPSSFARLWRSRSSFEQALAEAYGRPAGQVAADWARTYFEPREGGPTFPRGTIPVSLGWMALALVAAGLVAGKRQVTPT